ncbi:MAG: hypothetical protein HUJ31_12545, partial [Pseudomonadales bacterium]|nr:hypothetical protein [Pseudomonadales bacterium]
MDTEQARVELERIDREIDAGTYRRGRWQRFLKDASGLNRGGREALAKQVSAVSRKLH